MSRSFAGSDEGAPGLGARLGSATESDHAAQQGGAERLAAGGRVRGRNVPGRCQPGPEDGQARGEQAEGAVRTDAGHLRVRHQHDGGQGPEALRVPDLPEAATNRPQVRRFHRFRDGQQPETLDPTRRGPVV